MEAGGEGGLAAAGEGAEGAAAEFSGAELLTELRASAPAPWQLLLASRAAEEREERRREAAAVIQASMREALADGEAQRARLQAEAELMRRAILQVAAEPRPPADDAQ